MTLNGTKISTPPKSNLLDSVTSDEKSRSRPGLKVPRVGRGSSSYVCSVFKSAFVSNEAGKKDFFKEVAALEKISMIA